MISRNTVKWSFKIIKLDIAWIGGVLCWQCISSLKLFSKTVFFIMLFLNLKRVKIIIQSLLLKKHIKSLIKKTKLICKLLKLF
jgi:hypothetical protein